MRTSIARSTSSHRKTSRRCSPPSARWLPTGRFAPVLLLLVLVVGACSDEDSGALEPGVDESTTAEDAGEAAAPIVPDAGIVTAESRWPRPIPPDGYRTVAVAEPGSILGTVLAGVEGRGVTHELEEEDGCPGPPPVFPVGPVEGAVVRLEGVAAGAPLTAREPALDLASCAVSPRTQLASLGALARFASADGNPHEVRLIEAAGYRNLGRFQVPAEGEAERRLRVPGLVHVRCETHTGARGWIWVSEHPYVALTGADGAFAIKDVPRGLYVLHVWHEAFASAMQEVSVESGATSTADFTVGP